MRDASRDQRPVGVGPGGLDHGVLGPEGLDDGGAAVALLQVLGQLFTVWLGHLAQHQAVDEVHQELLERLEPLGVSIARREILYLFEAYCTLLRSSSEAKDDQQWLAQVEKNGGIIVSVDGIQPEKGNKTVYRYAMRSRAACCVPKMSRRQRPP